MKNTSVLEKIGLGKDASSIYLALLNLGPSSISEIVRKVSLHRPAVYKILPSLIDKGLVNIMPKGKYKIYVAESPDRLEKLFTELEDDFNQEINDLYEIYNSREKKPVVTFAEGKESMTAVYSDVVHSLKKGDTYYRYSSLKALKREKYIPKDYREVRDKKQLERLVITSEATKKLHNQKLGRTIKTVPTDFDFFEDDIAQVIYGDKISFIDYNTKTSITIENKMLAEFQKKIFRLLFKKL